MRELHLNIFNNGAAIVMTNFCPIYFPNENDGREQKHTLTLTNNAIKCILFANKLKKHIGNELFVKFAWKIRTITLTQNKDIPKRGFEKQIDISRLASQ